MVKPVAKAEINSFVKGLISESSPLNFPADASRDEENFELNRDGSRNRRLGVDFEPSYQLRSTGYTSLTMPVVAVAYYRWLGAGNNPDAEFLVIQIGSHIDIYQAEGDSISASTFIGSVTLTGLQIGTKLSFASIDGKLVAAGGTELVHVIEWNGSTLSYTTGSLKVRDLWGLPGYDGNEVHTRPTSLATEHLYNLRNQGWGVPRKDASGTLKDPIDIFNTEYTAFPASSETVYTGLQFQPASPPTYPTPWERIYPSLYNEVLGLSDQAAKGYYIIDVLKRGTSRAQADLANRTRYPSLTRVPGTIKSDTTSGGASLAIEYAGRVFYAGFKGTVSDPETNSPNLSNYVLFSQVVKSRDDLFKCYQVGDPTSREGSDIVDTDGGFIRIAGAKKLIGMKVLANNLFIICDNGVWKITGGSEYGFGATNYRVDKISAAGGFSEKTLVEVNDSLYFWGDEGIFQVARNQFGDWEVKNISQATIQTIYDEIDLEDKRNSVGIYDQGGKKIRWLVGNTNDPAATTEVVELILDLVLGSFSKNRIYNLTANSPRVIGYTATPSSVTITEEKPVQVGGVQVQVGGVDLNMTEVTGLPQASAVKFITLYGTSGGNVTYTFSLYRDEDFRDWKTADGEGVDALAFIMTGTTVAGDSSVFKQTPYLVMHFRKTEDGVKMEDGDLVPNNPSSCFLRSMWNWADSAKSGQWGNLFQAYRYRRPLFITGPTDLYDNGFETVVTKNKLRGRGRALSLYIETEPYKNCVILGWNLSITGNSLP
jgi:hypothetical protein